MSGEFMLVAGDKPDLSLLIKRDADGLVARDADAVRDYAVSGALHYAKRTAGKSSWHKALAFGVSGVG